jgi:hypothetical protein
MGLMRPVKISANAVRVPELGLGKKRSVRRHRLGRLALRTLGRVCRSRMPFRPTVQSQSLLAPAHCPLQPLVWYTSERAVGPATKTQVLASSLVLVVLCDKRLPAFWTKMMEFCLRLKNALTRN